MSCQLWVLRFLGPVLMARLKCQTLTDFPLFQSPTQQPTCRLDTQLATRSLFSSGLGATWRASKAEQAACIEGPSPIHQHLTSLTSQEAEPHPLVVGRPLRLVLEVTVQRRPGHRQAVEMSHFQGTHLLHLRSQPFLHALAKRRRVGVKRVVRKGSVCVPLSGAASLTKKCRRTSLGFFFFFVHVARRHFSPRVESERLDVKRRNRKCQRRHVMVRWGNKMAWFKGLGGDQKPGRLSTTLAFSGSQRQQESHFWIFFFKLWK